LAVNRGQIGGNDDEDHHHDTPHSTYSEETNCYEGIGFDGAPFGVHIWNFERAKRTFREFDIPEHEWVMLWNMAVDRLERAVAVNGIRGRNFGFSVWLEAGRYQRGGGNITALEAAELFESHGIRNLATQSMLATAINDRFERGDVDLNYAIHEVMCLHLTDAPRRPACENPVIGDVEMTHDEGDSDLDMLPELYPGQQALCDRIEQFQREAINAEEQLKRGVDEANAWLQRCHDNFDELRSRAGNARSSTDAD
jgi:hypothetical protein